MHNKTHALISQDTVACTQLCLATIACHAFLSVVISICDLGFDSHAGSICFENACALACVMIAPAFLVAVVSFGVGFLKGAEMENNH